MTALAKFVLRSRMHAIETAYAYRCFTWVKDSPVPDSGWPVWRMAAITAEVSESAGVSVQDIDEVDPDEYPEDSDANRYRLVGWPWRSFLAVNAKYEVNPLYADSIKKCPSLEWTRDGGYRCGGGSWAVLPGLMGSSPGISPTGPYSVLYAKVVPPIPPKSKEVSSIGYGEGGFVTSVRTQGTSASEGGWEILGGATVPQG